MPWLLCPSCSSWSLRRAWGEPAHGFRFTIACPACGVVVDVADVTLTLWPPDAVLDEQRTAALALRVWRAVAALSA